MKTAGAITVLPFSRPAPPNDVLDIIATVQFWRLRAVEFTLLALIVFAFGFAIASRI